MAQLTNDALIEILVSNGETLGDDIFLFAGASVAQAGGYPVKSSVHRVVGNAVANASLTMESLLSNVAASLVWIINDSANAVAVFSFPGEKMAGALNGSFAVTAGNAGVFVAIPVLIKRKGGSSGGGTLNWSPALISS